MIAPLGRTAVFLMLIAGVLAACGLAGGEDSGCGGWYPSRSHAAGSYNYGSSVGKFDFWVDPGMSTTQLQLRFHNEGGVVAWSFRDPADQVRWAGSFHEGERFEEMREFEPTQGEWRLEIDGSQASGSYDVCWLGR